MTIDLLTQLAEYGSYHDEEQGAVEAEGVLDLVSAATLEGGTHSIETLDPAEDPTVEYLELWADESYTPAVRTGWSGIAAAVAAAILVVVGVIVVTDEPTGEVATDPVAPAGVRIDSLPAVEPASLVWSRVPHDQAILGEPRAQTMRSVTVGGPGLVAVGSVGDEDREVAAVWTSVDGTTWLPVARLPDSGPRPRRMNSVTAGGPGLVAVGWAGEIDETVAAVWTSVDGSRWSRVEHDRAVFGADGHHRMNSVTAGGPGLVAVGSDGTGHDNRVAAVWTSVDGLSWSRVPHDEAIFGGFGTIQSPQIYQYMSSVTAGGPGLVAVGGHSDTDAAVWTSVDGLSWSRVPHDEAVFGPRGSQRMNSVTPGGPGLVAVGSEGSGIQSGIANAAAVWNSVDGFTWSRVPHDEAVFGSGEIHSVTAAGPGLVAVGGDGGFYGTRGSAVAWVSVDGLTWSRVPHDEAVFGGGEIHSVIIAGTGLVAVGHESLENKIDENGQEASEDGESVLVWVAEPPADGGPIDE